MGFISTNLLNRFWTKGCKPIKTAVDTVNTNIGTLSSLKTSVKTNLVSAINDLVSKKFDIANIVASINITKSGYLMDGKTASEAIDKLSRFANYGRSGLIGTSIDGLDLYRETTISTVEGFVNSSTLQKITMPFFIPSGAKVRKIEAIMVKGSTMYPIPYISSSGENQTFIYGFVNNGVIFYNKANWDGYSIYISIEYIIE